MVCAPLADIWCGPCAKQLHSTQTRLSDEAQGQGFWVFFWSKSSLLLNNVSVGSPLQYAHPGHAIMGRKLGDHDSRFPASPSSGFLSILGRRSKVLSTRPKACLLPEIQVLIPSPPPPPHHVLRLSSFNYTSPISAASTP